MRWAPARSEFPMQGISVSEANGPLDWRTVRARHADFAYVLASAGAGRRDHLFAANWSGARDAGLRYGAAHLFNLCDRAVDQATLFVATVPRDNAALPPVVRLDFSPNCIRRPGRDKLLSELNTFLNLIEKHVGQRAVIHVSKAFEMEYRISAGIYRTLWLEGNFFKPDYAGRPWVMWTASDMRHLDGIDGPVEWDVVAP
ncbi:glycoside hydrolase family 25 [Sphingobium sp. SCG-1]|nr:GH25 family lysozyme [Sphingobium sp. SCG-1]AUW60212.1 glycoside hydrolase family 25 [Sphingobium sp. SCG-1]